jgi:hypothetical protein
MGTLDPMRRLVVATLVGGAVVTTAVVVSRRRAAAPLGGLASAEPDWAPLRLLGPVPEPSSARPEPSGARPSAAPAPAADHVERAERAEPVGTKWVDPDHDGGCPGTHPVKGNRKSRIYHLPGGRFYDTTRAQRCYCDAEAAEADGLRASKS